MDSFNEMDNGYHVEPVIYAQAMMGKDESGGLQTADMRLLMDVMQGENGDVVMDDSLSPDNTKKELCSRLGNTAFCHAVSFFGVGFANSGRRKYFRMVMAKSTQASVAAR